MAIGGRFGAAHADAAERGGAEGCGGCSVVGARLGRPEAGRCRQDSNLTHAPVETKKKSARGSQLEIRSLQRYV